MTATPLDRNYTLDHPGAVALVSKKEPLARMRSPITTVGGCFLVDKRSSHVLKRKSVAVKEFTLNRCPA